MASALAPGVAGRRQPVLGEVAVGVGFVPTNHPAIGVEHHYGVGHAGRQLDLIPRLLAAPLCHRLVALERVDTAYTTRTPAEVLDAIGCGRDVQGCHQTRSDEALLA